MDESEKSPFQPGDVVKLRSGSPPLTVNHVFLTGPEGDRSWVANVAYYAPERGVLFVEDCIDQRALLKVAPPQKEEEGDAPQGA